MKQVLIERYIYAVTKRMPKKTGEDVAKELQALIADMLEEQCAEAEPTESDVKEVLTKLGTPTELYEKYTAEGKSCLIGTPYYTLYKDVLKIVLACTAFGLTLSAILSFLMGDMESILFGILHWLGTLSSGLLVAFAMVTLLFAFFYQKDIPLDVYSDLDNLPPVPEKRERISKKESIAGIAFTLVFLIIFLVCPQVFCAVITDTNELIPIFNLEVIRSTRHFIVMFALIGVFREIIKILDGKYTKRVMVTTVAADIISGFFAVIWLGRDNIINQEFIIQARNLFAQESVFIQNMFVNFQYFFMGVILFALVLDMGDTLIKGMRAKKGH